MKELKKILFFKILRNYGWMSVFGDHCHSRYVFSIVFKKEFFFPFPAPEIFFFIAERLLLLYIFISLLFQRTVLMSIYSITSPLITTPSRFIKIIRGQREVSHKIITFICHSVPMDGTLIWDWSGIWRFLAIIWLWMEFRM